MKPKSTSTPAGAAPPVTEEANQEEDLHDDEAAVDRILGSVTPATEAPAPAAPAPAWPRLTTGVVVAFDPAADTVTVRCGSTEAVAQRDEALHPTVLAGALERGERVLVERDAGGAAVVIGALRTQPIPGLDEAESYHIKAARIRLDATEEMSLTARTAGLVLRAVGEVETYSERIISRAEGVHKIIGRMLRLN